MLFFRSVFQKWNQLTIFSLVVVMLGEFGLIASCARNYCGAVLMSLWLFLCLVWCPIVCCRKENMDYVILCGYVIVEEY